MSLELNVDESVEKKVIAVFFEAICWNENNNKKKIQEVKTGPGFFYYSVPINF